MLTLWVLKLSWGFTKISNYHVEQISLAHFSIYVLAYYHRCCQLIDCAIPSLNNIILPSPVFLSIVNKFHIAMCLFSNGSHYVITTTEWYTKCNWKCHWCFYNILTSKNIKNYSLSLIYIQHMAIAGKEPCFFGQLISSNSPKNNKKENSMINISQLHSLINLSFSF